MADVAGSANQLWMHERSPSGSVDPGIDRTDRSMKTHIRKIVSTNTSGANHGSK
jgi:hypothetical protein